MNLDDVLQRLQDGDNNAFADIVAHYQRPLFGYLGRLGMTQASAEELAQETFLRAWKNLGAYDASRGAFSTWLFTLARHLALNERSSARYHHEINVADELLPDHPCERLTPPDALTQAQQRSLLQEALCTLPLTERSALALTYFQELSLAEVAKIENCTVNALKQRLHRAKLSLRQQLEKNHVL